MDPEHLENQLTSIMKAVMEVYKELNESGEAKSEEINETLMKKSKEIVFLSKNLNKSIDECDYLSKDQTLLDQQIADCFEEKSKKLEEFAKFMSGTGKNNKKIKYFFEKRANTGEFP